MTEKLRPTCHPERPHGGLGMCRACYGKHRRELERQALIAHREFIKNNPLPRWPA